MSQKPLKNLKLKLIETPIEGYTYKTAMVFRTQRGKDHATYHLHDRDTNTLVVGKAEEVKAKFIELFPEGVINAKKKQRTIALTSAELDARIKAAVQEAMASKEGVAS